MAVTVKIEAASWVRPLAGEHVGGDVAVVRELDDGLLVAMVDVLGHGPEAHELAVRIQRFIEGSAITEPGPLMAGLHEHIRGSRGAAAGICRIRRDDGTLTYVGHGNTRLRRLWQQPARLVSRDGLIGGNIRGNHMQTLKLRPGDVVIMYTDGVSDRFELDDYRHVISDTARSVARNVVEMFGKDYDDAGCIAVRAVD